MTDENTTALPYRNGIRVAPEEPTEPLPDLLTVRYDELVARDRAEWEAHVKTPAWWLEHVARHTLARSKSNPAANPPDFRTAHPSWRPLRNSMLWTLFLGVSWIVAYKITTEMPCYNPARMASLICVGEAVLAACIAVAEKEDFRWSLKHVLLVPMSLYLTLKEYIAWKRWTKSGEIGRASCRERV